ncbi:glycosyltransferase [Paenibacillus sp. 7523-1]|uniref:glycosyltransferase n=1 Tax=Paenibacillus sp. 7523-1 TaxID=2022550 RepID=UPI000BA72129|nr:glycosyltransferase [Paenibacillus sp. 7523-1]PAD30659.1 hypothetical protein CHH60_15080 [Paenibacillus sp. 7523-1]
MQTSIIISGSKDAFQYLLACIDSIRKFTEKGTYQLIVVENGETFQYRDWLMEQTDIITVFNDSPISQAKAWNTAMRIASGENILFMHSDTIVTENWLIYMIQTLYQDLKVAGVGPISNFTEIGQKVDVNPASLEEMFSFACNNSRHIRQKEKVTLSNFCILFKKNILHILGDFNECLTGEAMAIEYSVRACEAGYKLISCEQVFVYHYGISDVSFIDQDVVFEKWEMDHENFLCNFDILENIEIESVESLRILEVGCGLGATLLELTQQNPDIHVFGIERRTTIAPSQLEGKIKTSIQEHAFDDNSLDYIILNSLVEDLKFDECFELLKPKGKLIVNIPNLNSYKNIMKILENKPMKKGLNIAVVNEFGKQLNDMNFENIKLSSTRNKIPSNYNNVILEFEKLIGRNVTSSIEIDAYILEASKPLSINQLHELFNRLMNNPFEADLEKLISSSSPVIVRALASYTGPVIPLLNYLAITSYERKKNEEDIFLLLNKAYELDPSNEDTIFNVSTIHLALGNEVEALNWLLKISNKTEQIKNWIYEIEQSINLKKDPTKWLSFLVLRIENNVQRRESLLELMKVLQNKHEDIKRVRTAIKDYTLDPLSTINILVNRLYEYGEYNMAINMLEYSLEFGSDKDETLFLISNIFYKIGDYAHSISYLNSVSIINEKVLSLRERLDSVESEIIGRLN